MLSYVGVGLGVCFGVEQGVVIMDAELFGA